MELEQWVNEQLGTQQIALRPLSGDAGFRRYFRTEANGRPWVIMDASADRASCAPFARVARMLAEGGLHVPVIEAWDEARGWMILPDLGEQTFLDALGGLDGLGNLDALVSGAAGTLFEAALAALVQLQRLAPPADLPRYDEALLRRELKLFPEWYLERHLGVAVDGELAALLERLFDTLVTQALGQGQVLVHRDFMPRNLMVGDPSPGVLDFQDAVVGPVSYDPVSLFRDAFISWPEPRVAGWLTWYWQQAQVAGLPVPISLEQFLRDCDLMGVQRHLKVIGIFARICHRDGKPHYLADVPRFVNYLRGAAARQPDLTALAELIERVWPEAGA